MGALKVWDGTQWTYVMPPPEATVAAVAPTPTVAGQLWFNTVTDILMVWDGTAWWPARPATPYLPAIAAYKTGAQTLTSGTSAMVSMNVVRRASGGMSLNGGLAQIPQDGWYQVNVSVSFQASTSSARRIVGVATGNTSLVVGAVYTSSILASAQDTSNITGLSSSGAFFFSAGDLVGPWANALANWGIEVGQTYNTCLSVAWLGYDGINL